MATDVIDYKIHGDIMQILEIELDPGEAMLAETGAMVMMTEGIHMSTGTGGGFLNAVKRKVVGEKFLVSRFENRQGPGKEKVGFAAPYPGHIIPIDLHEHRGSFICQRDGFLACANGIDLSIHFNKRIGAGLFSGEGFILQKLEGVGMAFVHAGGNMIKINLKAGEKLRCDIGCMLGYTHGVDFSIEYVGGFINPLFGGEGVFLGTLTGPGMVIIQSIPFQRVVDAITESLKKMRKLK